MDGAVRNFQYNITKCSRNVKDVLFKSYIRSRVLYQYTPLVCTGDIDAKEVEWKQIKLIRKFLRVPNDVSNNTVRNIMLRERFDINQLLERRRNAIIGSNSDDI